MKQRCWLAAVLTAGVLCTLGACGDGTDTNDDGDGGSGGSGASAPTPASYCTAKLAREAECEGSASETQSECEAGSGCMFDLVRPDILGTLVSCVNGRACDEGDDACWYETGANDPIPEQVDYGPACQDMLLTCPDVFDDYCALTVATADVFLAMTACLSLPCAEVAACLDGALPASCAEG